MVSIKKEREFNNRVGSSMGSCLLTKVKKAGFSPRLTPFK
jgi:hypothetical protein